MYSWAINIQKLRRAEAMTPGGSEEQIKEAYTRMGGKLGGETPPVAPEPEPVVEETIKKTDNETPPVAPKVKRVRQVKAK